MTAHSFGRDAETAEDGPNLAMMGGEQGAKRQKVSSEEVRDGDRAAERKANRTWKA